MEEGSATELGRTCLLAQFMARALKMQNRLGSDQRPAGDRVWPKDASRQSTNLRWLAFGVLNLEVRHRLEILGEPRNPGRRKQFNEGSVNDAS